MLSKRAYVLCVAGLSLAMMVWAYVCVRRSSPTFDETLHAVAAHVVRHEFDYRVNPEDPPLWQYWANLPHASGALALYTKSPEFDAIIDQLKLHWNYCVDVLFARGLEGGSSEVPAGQAFVDKSRLMMIPVGGVLVVLAAVFSGGMARAMGLGEQFARWVGLGGAVLVATDPNLIAHSGLVKNDVTFTVLFLAMGHAALLAGKELTPRRLIYLMLVAGLGPCVKFSGVLMMPTLALLLAARCVMGGAWQVRWAGDGGKSIGSLMGKAGLGAGVFGCAALATVFLLWASYGFRYAATPDPNRPYLNTAAHVESARLHTLIAELNNTQPPAEALAAAKVPGVVRLAVWLEEMRVLPQAWTNGFVFTYASSKIRFAYLHETHSFVGWWYYFPMTLLYKLSLAHLGAMVLGVLLGAVALRHLRRENENAEPRSAGARLGERGWLKEHGWPVACVVVPGGFYLAVAMSGNLNLGIRHVFPSLVYLYVGTAVVLGWVTGVMFRKWEEETGGHVNAGQTQAGRGITGVKSGVARGALGALVATVLAAEGLMSTPNLLGFFNGYARSRDELTLLSDSNFDWGQDLLRLRDWQDQNPEVPLYLAYFGTARPEAYGLRFGALPGTMFTNQRQVVPDKPGVIAISATILQGVYQNTETRLAYNELRRKTPIGRVGSSIYLYAFEPGK